MSDSKPEYLKQLLICLILIKPYHFEPITDVSKYSVKACKGTGDQKGGGCCLFQFNCLGDRGELVDC